MHTFVKFGAGDGSKLVVNNVFFVFKQGAGLHQFLAHSMPFDAELDMGAFLLTQSNPIHQLMDPIQSNP